MLGSVRSRLVVASCAMVALAIIAAAAVSIRSARQFADELSQRLNRNVAMYVAARGPLANAAGLDTAALQQIAEQAMIFNPSIRVHLIDESGLVLWSVDRTLVSARRVSLQPVRQLLAEQRTAEVIYGDDPARANERALISVMPVNLGPEGAGYVYITLGAALVGPWWVSVSGSQVLQWSIAALLVMALLAGLAATAATRWLTRPLRDLREQVACSSRELGLTDSVPEPALRDEIDSLRLSFAALTLRVRQQVQELKSTDKLRRELFAHISHDLRTPLTAMRGYLETLSTRGAELSAEQQRAFIEIVRKHSERLYRLVEQVFLLAKLDAAALPAQPEMVAIADLAQDIVSKWRFVAEKKGIQLRLERGSDLPLVHADVALMETVLENLLDNSLRHSPRGSEVVISLARIERRVQVTVRDQGPGIDPGLLQHIHEPFVVGPGGRSGLGLAIVGRVLRLHESSLDLESQPGQGTTASFALSSAPSRAA